MRNGLVTSMLRHPARTERSRAIRLLLVVAAVVAASRARADSSDPVPVLGGDQVLSPGPRSLGFRGIAADPSSIGNFQGLVALAYLRGRVRDATGHRWVMENDIRILQGTTSPPTGCTGGGRSPSSESIWPSPGPGPGRTNSRA